MVSLILFLELLNLKNDGNLNNTNTKSTTVKVSIANCVITKSGAPYTTTIKLRLSPSTSKASIAVSLDCVRVIIIIAAMISTKTINSYTLNGDKSLVLIRNVTSANNLYPTTPTIT